MKLMIIAKKSGFNQTGIITINNKIIVEIINDSCINFPIDNFENLQENYTIIIPEILKKANQNLIKNHKCIKKIEALIIKNF